MASNKNVHTPAAPVSVSPAIVALCVRLGASMTGGLYLTQSEALAAVTGGYATVDLNDMENDAAFVTLTETGEKLATENQGEDAGESQPEPNRANVENEASKRRQAAKVQLEADTDIPPPTGRTRGSNPLGLAHQIENMEVGHSFHFAKTSDNPKPSLKLASTVANARLKFAIPHESGETKTVTVKEYAKGPDGKMLKDANGKRIVASTKQVTRPITVNTRDWDIASVGANDPKGEGARVWRIEP